MTIRDFFSVVIKIFLFDRNSTKKTQIVQKGVFLLILLVTTFLGTVFTITITV